MGDHFDTMQLCKRWGHIVTEFYDSSPNGREDFCQKCGSETTHACQKCKTNIRGYHHYENIVGGGTPEAPLNCHKCGAAYPWKTKLLWKKAGVALISPVKYLVDAVVGIFKK